MRLAPILMAMILLAVAGCGRPEPASAPPVKASGERLVLARGPVDDLKPVTATVTTRNMAEARSRIGGILASLSVREGDTVRAGQVIGQVRDERLGLLTRADDAQVLAAAAEADRARADLKRIQSLFDKGIYAQARLDQARAGARSAEASLAAARAQRAAGADLAGQGTILAPATGRVLTAQTPVGSVVAAGQSVATITAGEPLLRIEVPEGQAASLRVGQAVSLQPGDLPGAAAAGQVIQVYPSVTAGQVTADVRVAGLSAVLVGSRVRVQLPVGQRQALTIPRRFIVSRYGLDYVRLLQANGSALETPVQTAPTGDPARVEILSGAAAGDVLVAP
ncbi:RND family efflux transporter MFP subunit [Caulobacter ginsengisoli]|uniref:RND family efflux transporter MFP subunit n=1 Tax=Caulobacter ginsengisoli TaxID=400775 RepID=A0ABU0IXK3_9CAUL|nr:efflux RND transporter periplasmic adaptor subunit [Caulobacter ginsengisoli]MDQ0466746.1 RND family efflux transporter MFP subunit [Caulobacter ginsengisoli]